MSTTYTIGDKMYGTGDGVIQNVTGYIPLGSKITRINPGDSLPLVDAFNIDWASGKYSYDGNSDHIIQSTGHLIEIINSKSSATGEVWDDIKDDAYITSQINIYTSSSSSTISPNIIWGDDTTTEYDGFTSYLSLPNTSNNVGWHTSVDTIPGSNPYVFMSSIYMVKSLANNILGYHGPSSTPIYLSSESGLNGNFKSTVFVRSTNKIPDTPYNGAYYGTGLPKEQYAYIRGTEHSNANRISYNRESEFKCWSDGIPAGNETLWATTAIISDDNGNFDSTAVWSTPRQMTDTATYDVEFAKKQENDATPSAPNNSNSGVLPTGTKIWYDPTNDPTENWTEMYWRAERSCINGIWGNWIITRIKGEQGQAGVQGAFKSTAFIRTNVDISQTIPTGGNYNSPVPTSTVRETEGQLEVILQWSDGIPNNTEKQLWSTWKTFNPGGDDSDWSKPVKVQDTQYYDVEFSYLSSIASNQKPNTNNRHKEISPYDGQIWFDPTLDPTDNDITGSYTWSDMIWRAERENINGNWSDWVITRIKGEDGLQGTPPRYYQTRYTRTSETTLNTDYYLPSTGYIPTDAVITMGNQNWTTYIPDNTNNTTPHVWQSSRGVDWHIDNNTNNWAEQWEDGSTWSTPFMLDGLPGESQPIHPVLFYKWALSPTTNEHYTPGNLPEFNDRGGGIILHDWAESPGNPSGNNKYLWMIQGEYKLNGTTREYQLINGNSYWTNPVCLSGEDGQPGQDGDDLEFIYHIYDTVPQFGNNDNNPSHWSPNQQTNYLGPTGYEWTNNPTGVTILNKYEYCAYRRKTGNPKTWGTFSEPFPWSIYGENGIDGDGVEYIYYRSDSITPPNSGDTYPPSWTNNSSINAYFQHDDFPCIEEVTGSSWDTTTNTGKQNNSYIYHGWTDEPQGVSNNHNEKYEFVAVRKKGFKTGSITEKEWKSFSSPTLWANYAEDGVATSMVLETDNDNVTVGVDGQNIVNNRYQTIAHIYLQYNGTPIDKSYYTLTLSFAKGSPTNFDIANNNTIVYRPTQNIGSEYNIISINNSGTVPYLDIDIPKDMDMSSVNNLLSIQITATCNSNIGSVTNGDVSAGSAFTRIFNLTGVELSIEDIYQIGLSTTTSHRNPQNDGFEPISLWLNSFTSTNTLTTVNDAAAKHIFISYYSTNKNISGIPESSSNGYLTNFSNISLNPDYNKHIFTAHYNTNVNIIDNVNLGLINSSDTKFLDKEEVTAVYDGKNGVDSQSEEYIYLLTDNFDFFENNTDKYYDVKNWKNNLISYKDNNDISYYQYNDYPFIINNNYINTESTSYVKSIKYSSSSSYNGSGFVDGNLIIGYWTDNPQGVSEEYPYEFRVPRNYLTSASENDRWQAFGTPQPWASWGHSGEDGDGVEYIYTIHSDKINNVGMNYYNPIQWMYVDSSHTFNEFQQNEYIPNYYSGSNPNINTIWTDNPHGVTETNKNEYVSVRKYKLFTETDFIKHLTNRAFYSYDFSTNTKSSTLSYINDSDEVLTQLYSYLINDYNKSSNYINIMSYTAAYIENNISNYQNTDIYNATHVYRDNIPDNNNYSNVYNFSIYSLLYYTLKAKTFVLNNQKLWGPYSQSKLWAKYGEQGPEGQRGGSGLTIDLSNPTMQIAVNNNRLIKDNQGITYTAINLYSGTQPISPSNFSISLNSAILNNENYKPFNISKQKYNGISYGFTIGTDNNNSYAYYQWEFTGNADVNDNTQLDDPFFTEDNALTHWDVPEGGIQLPLTISYNGQDYTKHLNIIGIIDGKDGKDAETWELHCAYSTIHYNRMLDNPYYEPGSVQYSIKHVVGQTTHEILDFATVNSNLNNELSLSYWFEYNENQIAQPSQPKIYGDENAHASGSGIYLDNGTPVEKDTESIVNYSMDPTNISGTNELVITVNELDLRDSNNDPISNIESTLLDIIDSSTNYKDVLSAGNIRYTDGSISNVLTALTDYVENGNLRPDDKAEVNNIIATINAVVDSLGSISHDVFVLDSNISTIYVEDKETAPVIMTREAAIAEYNASREPTNNEGGSDEELQPGESAGRGLMSTPRSVNIPNTAYTSTNGEVNISDYVNSNNSNLKSVHVALVRSNNLWDEDILEVVYDGIDGVDGNGVEYIYYLSQGTEQPTFGNDWTSGNNNNYASNPTWWTPNGEVINGYSYVGKSDFIPPAQQSNWFDHPQGVTSSRTWEYISMREYDGETQTWGRYTSPQPWSHFGENGRDGDGVEYIFWRPNGTTIQTWNTTPGSSIINTDPRTWPTNGTTAGKNGKKFQDTEYLGPTSSPWTDNPTGVTAENSYEYVSQRKYNGSTKLWEAFSMPAVWTNYGQRGPQGNPGSSAFVIDWTNDQINLAVDANGYVIGGENGQVKETSINIESLNGVFGNNPTITMEWSNGTNFDDTEMPWKRFTKNYESTMTTNNVKVYVQAYDYNTTTAIESNSINCLHGNTANTLKIIVGKNYPAANASDKAYIPPEGLELKVKVTITDPNNVNNSVTQLKILRVCGQHIGENAVTYELNISPNALSNPSSTSSVSITVAVIKYEGNTQTALSQEDINTLNFRIRYLINGGVYTTTSIGTQSLSIGASKTSITFKLYNSTITFNNSTCIDTETIPIVRDGSGGTGPQGFTGPIVRMRGEYVHNENTYYGNGEYKKNTGDPQYDGTSPLYKDIVTYTWTTGANAGKTKYYTPKSNITGSYITSNMSNSYLCTGSSYVHYQHPATSDGTTNSMWVDATQYEFVATRLLYADQALINQLSTHDLIATDQNGYPVAGITSGAPKMKDKDGTEITSIISTGNNNSGNTAQNVHISGSDPVRIFAGEIYDATDTSHTYSLTHAPFNVRQSGVAYITNAYISGEITANTLKLGPDSFWNVTGNTTSKTLPALHSGQTFQFIVLTNSYVDAYVITGNTSDSFMISAGGSATQGDITIDGLRYKKLTLRPNKLYQFISVNHQWNATEITLKIPDSLVEHYDCKNDVEIYAHTIYTDNDSTDYTSYYMENQNQGFWPRQIITDPVQRMENGVTITHHKAEFTFFTYLYNNERTEDGVNISLGDIMYWEQL